MNALHSPEVDHGHVVDGKKGEQGGELPHMHHCCSVGLLVPGNAGVLLLAAVCAG